MHSDDHQHNSRSGRLVARLWFSTLTICCLAAPLPADEPAPRNRQSGSTIRLKSMDVRLSQPVNVMRSKGHLWFANLVRRHNGDLFAWATNYADMYQRTPTCLTSWSRDSGRTWAAPQESPYGDIVVKRKNGDLVWLPYNLYHRPEGMGGDYRFLPAAGQAFRNETSGLVITGLPRADRRKTEHPDLAGFVFNGDSISASDHGYLATLYGTFAGDKQSALLLAHSNTGLRWHIRSIIADKNSELPGESGPSESSLCRLKDGRLMCVFRSKSYVKYTQSFSSDDGKTWSALRQMDMPFSVQPSLVALPGGAVTLSGGRPGLYLWINATGDGLTWEPVDLRENHNRTTPADYIHESENITAETPLHHFRHETTSYTQTVMLDDTHVMVAYDRGPHGGEKIEPFSPESNSVWVVHVELQPSKR